MKNLALGLTARVLYAGFFVLWLLAFNTGLALYEPAARGGNGEESSDTDAGAPATETPLEREGRLLREKIDAQEKLVRQLAEEEKKKQSQQSGGVGDAKNKTSGGDPFAKYYDTAKTPATNAKQHTGETKGLFDKFYDIETTKPPASVADKGEEPDDDILKEYWGIGQATPPRHANDHYQAIEHAYDQAQEQRASMTAEVDKLYSEHERTMELFDRTYDLFKERQRKGDAILSLASSLEELYSQAESLGIQATELMTAQHIDQAYWNAKLLLAKINMHSGSIGIYEIEDLYSLQEDWHYLHAHRREYLSTAENRVKAAETEKMVNDLNAMERQQAREGQMTLYLREAIELSQSL